MLWAFVPEFTGLGIKWPSSLSLSDGAKQIIFTVVLIVLIIYFFLPKKRAAGGSD